MLDSFDKKARKSAKDPKQEKLRDHKDAWNDVTSILIAKLIAFKRGLNGAGDDRAEIPPSRITEPLPPELETYLSSITKDYSDIIQGAKFIINEQKDYSNQFGHKDASADINLTVEASSALSRAWARIGLIGDPDRKLRIDLLNIFSSMIHDFWDLENQLTNRSEKDGHGRAVLDLHNILTRLNASVSPDIELLAEEFAEDPAKEENEEESDTGEKPNEFLLDNVKSPEDAKSKEKSVYEEDAPIIIDLNEKLLENLNIVRDNIDNLTFKNREIKHKFPDSIDLEAKIFDLSRKEVSLRTLIKEDPLSEIVNHMELARDIFMSYKDISSALEKYKIDNVQASVEEMYTFIKQQEEIQKIAHNVITRWIQRKIMETFPGKYGAIINRAVKHIRQAVDHINILLDLIEERGSGMLEILTEYRKLIETLEDLVPQIVSLGQLYINERRKSRTRGLTQVSKGSLRDLQQTLVQLKRSAAVQIKSDE